MDLYKINEKGLMTLDEHPFKLERELQQLFEANLSLLTGLEMIRSEFSIQNQRIDTLAYDSESQSFVIIEYKRATNASVLDQGVSYLNTLLKYKADFVLEYQERTGKNLTKKTVDWSQSKVVFVSPNFTNFQKQAVDFKDLNIELWEVKRYSDGTLLINGVTKSENAPSIKMATDKSDTLSSLKEIHSYTEENHFAGKSDEIIECYDEFKQAFLKLIPDVMVEPRKYYIAFKKHKRNIVYIKIQQKQLKIFINAKLGSIDDPKGILNDVSALRRYGNSDYQAIVKDTLNLEYIMSLVKQTL